MVAAEDLSEEEAPHEGTRPLVATDLYMDGVRSPIDGSDIGSRRLRREHMKVHGLVDADDYKQEWSKKAERRERFLSGKGDGRDWVSRFEQTYERLKHKGRK